MWIGASGTTSIVENRNPASRAYCHPDNFKGVTNILNHNNGDGTFTDVSAKAGIANPEGKGLGVSFADYDDDGFTDIFVANHSVPSFLYHNNGNGTFTEVGLPAGVTTATQISLSATFPTSAFTSFRTMATAPFEM